MNQNHEPRYALGGKIKPPSYPVPETITAGQPLFIKPGQEPCQAEIVHVAKRRPSAAEVVLSAIADTFKPLGEALVEAGKEFMKMLYSVSSTTDDLREQRAIKHGRRYWEDSRHRVRRTPGHQPLIHNGKAKR